MALGDTLNGPEASPHLGLDNKGCFSCTCGHLWLPEGAAARIAVTLEIETSGQLVKKILQHPVAETGGDPHPPSLV